MEVNKKIRVQASGEREPRNLEYSKIILLGYTRDMLGLLLYISTFASAVALRKNEVALTAVLIAIFLTLAYLRQKKKTFLITAVCIGITMTFVEYVCVRLKMWTYYRVHHILPTWLPVLWAIVVLFALDVNTRLVELGVA